MIAMVFAFLPNSNPPLKYLQEGRITRHPNISTNNKCLIIRYLMIITRSGTELLSNGLFKDTNN